MALNALVDSFCHNQKSVGLKGKLCGLVTVSVSELTKNDNSLIDTTHVNPAIFVVSVVLFAFS